MKVYILIYEDGWNGTYRIEGVYSSFQMALAARTEFLNKVTCKGIFGIREMTVDA